MTARTAVWAMYLQFDATIEGEAVKIASMHSSLGYRPARVRCPMHHTHHQVVCDIDYPWLSDNVGLTIGDLPSTGGNMSQGANALHVAGCECATRTAERRTGVFGGML